MTTVNTDMLVNVKTVSKTSNAQSNSNSKTDGASFQDVLTKAMPNCYKTVSNTDCETETDVKDLVEKLLQTISNGTSNQEIEKLTDGLSTQQLDMLTELIAKITQLIFQEINTSEISSAEKTAENPLLEAISSMMGEQAPKVDTLKDGETSDESKVSQVIQKGNENLISQTDDEVISTVASAIAEIAYVNFDNATNTANKTDENIAPEIIQTLSENSKDKLINIENILSNLSEKLSESNPQIYEFATKLQAISQEISKTLSANQENLSQITITDIKVATTSDIEGIVKENSLVSSENFDNALMKVTKNESELSELTALTGNVKTDATAMQGEQIKSVEAPVENQVLNFIKTQVLPSVKTSGTSEMSMTLNPEQLGQISVKLEKTGTELTVAITCHNSVTQEMMENRLPQLISSLSAGENKTVNVNIVAPNENASQLMNNFNMSQQNGHQQFQSHSQPTHYVEGNEIIDNVAIPEEIYKEGRLWQTV